MAGRGSMRAELIGTASPAWVSDLRRTAHDFYHEPSYVALCATQENGEAWALHVEDAGSSMLLPVVLRPIPGGGLDASSPYGYPGPIMTRDAGPEWLATALATGVAELREAGVVTLFVRMHPLLNPSPPEGVGTLVTHGETVSIDLTATDEELWSRTRLNHRRDINRAIGAGYLVRMDEDWRHFEAFKRSYHETMERRSAAQFYRFDDAYFDGLRAALAGRIHLCVVELQGEMAAGGLFVETDGIVEYHLSGTRANTSPPTR